MDTSLLVALAIFLIIIVFATIYGKIYQKDEWYSVKNLENGLNTPTVWLYIDDTDVNSRWWADFGARSSRVLNLPFLNLCYQTIVKACGDKYHVEVISGLQDAEKRLGYLPAPMRNKRIPLRDEEMTYLKVAFLEKYGGLWLNIPSIVLRPFPELPKDKVVFFGSDPLETYSGAQGTTLPNQHAMWSPSPQHPVFVQWKNILENRLEIQHTGKEIRTDKNWDILFTGTGKQDIIVMPNAELTRKKSGRKIELDDLLASGTDGNLTFQIHPETIYVPFPWPELLERRVFGWFLRMSENQVMESDLAVTYLFNIPGVIV
jgi:hypothetical protein